ncbi:MAG TPA: NUDIX domain-containing protein [Candidatus Dormibacteraeota bacterium]|nr:NUDIX domain-containing protein [Candidatus Dormibacteraeota bacterium]
MQKIIPEDAVLIPDQAERAFEGMIFDVYQWPQKLFDGSEHRFEMLKRPDTVSVICVDEDKVLVIEDEQPHLGLRTSFPGGRVDSDDENVEAAARREILEETGYVFKNWRLVRVWQPYRKMEWFVYVWLAWDVIDRQAATPDAGEKITLRPVDFSALKDLVMKRTSYLGDSVSIFENLDNIEELLTLPEFSGQTVDR